MGPELALAASARDWPDLVHRFLLDHGGGRVRARVMGAEQALATEYQVLVIDDVCSFLSPRLVRRLREQGKGVLGVFSPEDGPDAKRRLLECGISDVIEADARPEEFLQAIAATLSQSAPAPEQEITVFHSAFRVAVLSAATGAGGTEVAIALAASLALTRDVILIDLDQAHPGIAQRLDLPPHPNLRTAVDLAHHDQERLPSAVARKGALNVVGGVPGATPNGAVPRIEIDGLLEDLGQVHPTLVLDLGELTDSQPPVAQAQLMVGEASPVGLTRLAHAVERASSVGPRDLVAVVNRTAGGPHRRDDIRDELARAIPGVPTILLPEDRRIERAAWNGEFSRTGPFAKAVGRIAALIDEMTP